MNLDHEITQFGFPAKYKDPVACELKPKLQAQLAAFIWILCLKNVSDSYLFIIALFGILKSFV